MDILWIFLISICGAVGGLTARSTWNKKTDHSLKTHASVPIDTITGREPVKEVKNFRAEKGFIPHSTIHDTGETTFPSDLEPPSEALSCGAQATLPSMYALHYRKQVPYKRIRRSTAELRLIEVFVIMDSAMFTGLSLKSDQMNAEKYINNVIQNVDKWFTSDLDIRVVLVGIELWASDKITVVSDPKQLLEHMLQYASKNLSAANYDVVVLISGIDFDGTLAGMAFVGVICGPLSGVVIQHFPTDPNPELKSAVLLAHEIGHVIGLTHDTSSCGPTGSHIMAEDISSKPTSFSTCSKTELSTFLGGGQGHCMYDLPDSVYNGPICGNGVREKGEVCDCGDIVGCSKDPCCMYPCKLRPGAQCGSGGCCNSCKLEKSGTECRKQQDQCDIAEYCTGTQSECPENHYKADMTSCVTSGDAGNCYRGKCRSNAGQCERIWGVALARPGQLLCYGDNAKGNSLGNCGSSSTGTFKMCPLEDIMCGTLQCDTKQLSPQIGAHQVIALKTKTDPNGTIYSCKAATINLGADVPDPGLVEDGSPCYDVTTKQHGVCLSRHCIKTVHFPTVTCPNDTAGNVCSNNGVCNEVGTCVCNKGYGGSNCLVSITTSPSSPPTVSNVTGTNPRVTTHTTTTGNQHPPAEGPSFPVWAIAVVAVASTLLIVGAVVLVCCILAWKKRNRVQQINLNFTTKNISTNAAQRTIPSTNVPRRKTTVRPAVKPSFTKQTI